jgi:hypothetical protein
MASRRLVGREQEGHKGDAGAHSTGRSSAGWGSAIMIETTLALAIQTMGQVVPVAFPVRHLYLGGWAGRSLQDVQQHIDELVNIGVPTPAEIPILMPMPRHLVTTDPWIEVRDGATSGEVEYVLLFDGERLLVTAGSDHTDREIERVDIAKSKQLYPKVVAAAAWPYDEVRDHWDELELWCWVETNGRFELYQQGGLAALRSAESWLDTVRERHLLVPGMVLFSGSLPTIAGTLVYGNVYRFSLTDPVLGRRLEQSYRVLPLGGAS